MQSVIEVAPVRSCTRTSSSSCTSSVNLVLGGQVCKLDAEAAVSLMKKLEGLSTQSLLSNAYVPFPHGTQVLLSRPEAKRMYPGSLHISTGSRTLRMIMPLVDPPSPSSIVKPMVPSNALCVMPFVTKLGTRTSPSSLANWRRSDELDSTCGMRAALRAIVPSTILPPAGTEVILIVIWSNGVSTSETTLRKSKVTKLVAPRVESIACCVWKGRSLTEAMSKETIPETDERNGSPRQSFDWYSKLSFPYVLASGT